MVLPIAITAMMAFSAQPSAIYSEATLSIGRCNNPKQAVVGEGQWELYRRTSSVTTELVAVKPKTKFKFCSVYTSNTAFFLKYTKITEKNAKRYLACFRVKSSHGQAFRCSTVKWVR